MRHPIYSGIILIAMGWLLLDGSLSSLVVVVITLIYLPIGIHPDGLKLIARSGEDRRRYGRQVPAQLPRIWH